MPRIAVGSLFTECNHLGGRPLELADFERGELREGDALLRCEAGTLGGALRTLQAAGVEVIPLLAASCCPGGPLTAECHAELTSRLCRALAAAGPLDGVLLVLHGAATAEGVGDLEGDLLEKVRAQVGTALPVVATLDLHAHVTPAMIHAATALVAWETYPHADAFTTGHRAAQLLLDTVAGLCRPTMALAKVPVLTAAIHGGTEGPGPFRDVMQYAKWHERLAGVLSTSVFLVHPYLDLPGLGSGAVVVTDNNPALARELATRIAHLYWQRREALEPEVWSPVEAIRRGRHCPPGPVLLVETADCCGGGAAGDSVATLRALLTEGRGETAVVGVVDPGAAAACHAAGVGAAVRLWLGHLVDPQWGTPCELAGVVERLLGGEFTYRGGIFDGQTASMGPSAVVNAGGVRVLICSQGTYDWQGEQWEAAGLEARAFRFLVVKNPMNFRQTYGQLATGVFVLDTPGPTPATVRHVPYQQLTGGWYPRDRDLPLRMEVCESAG